MQREVGVDTDDWDIALKNTLRQAPDVILLGEIRDRETMEFAIQFAETGHLALATLHANNANQAMDRIINFFPEERKPQLLMDLSANMRSIISQRLLKTKEGKGRVAAIEILINSPLIKDLILKGEMHEIKPIMKKSRELGMQTFDQALFDLYENEVGRQRTARIMDTRPSIVAGNRHALPQCVRDDTAMSLACIHAEDPKRNIPKARIRPTDTKPSGIG